MNRKENILVTIAEECAEIQEAVTKSLRFGLNNHHPLEPNETNAQQLMLEFYQLTAVIEKAHFDCPLY